MNKYLCYYTSQPFVHFFYGLFFINTLFLIIAELFNYFSNIEIPTIIKIFSQIVFAILHWILIHTNKCKHNVIELS